MNCLHCFYLIGNLCAPFFVKEIVIYFQITLVGFSLMIRVLTFLKLIV